MEVKIVPTNKIVNIGYNNKNINIETDNEENININNRSPKIETETTFTKQLIANDYNYLENKPKIENIELKGNKSFEDLGAIGLTNIEIEKMFSL